MGLIRAWLDRHPIFEIPQLTAEGTKVYLRRWFLKGDLDTTERKVFVHEILLSDQGREIHDHPWHFLSIGLRGSYVETYHDRSMVVFKAPWVRWVPADRLHRLDLLTDKVWTLVLTGRKRRHWGFLTSDGWVPWESYVSDAPHIPGNASVMGGYYREAVS